VRGAFGSGAPNSAAPLSANRYGGTTSEIFLEAGAAPAAGQLISPTVFINTKALLGELQDDLQNGGAFWCHPNIKAALEVADALNFKTGVPSALGPITTYRGIPIFTSQALVAGRDNLRFRLRFLHRCAWSDRLRRKGAARRHD
jgi:hypothetical protein